MKAQTTYGEKVADARMRFVFYGRVSTEDKDPTLSLPRQLANCEKAVAEAGGRIVAHFYDVESGAMRLDARGSGKGLQGFEISFRETEDCSTSSRRLLREALARWCASRSTGFPATRR